MGKGVGAGRSQDDYISCPVFIHSFISWGVSRCPWGGGALKLLHPWMFSWAGWQEEGCLLS